MSDELSQRWTLLKARVWVARTSMAAAAFAAAMLLSGCLPSGGDSQDSSFSATVAKFSDNPGTDTQVNRSEKHDLMFNVQGENISRGLASTVGSVQRAGEQLVSFSRPEIFGGATVKPLPEAEPVPLDKALANFYAALHELESHQRKGPVTILHLGDQLIASDKFSGDLREQWQSRFGRTGRGLMLPAVSTTRGVKFDRGGDWRLLTSVSGEGGLYGITGLKVASSSNDAWLRLTALDESFNWAEVTLETGPNQGSAILSVDGDQKVVSTTSPSREWKTIRLNKQGRQLTIRVKGDGEIRIHSWAIGNDKPGINYVSLGLNKATGLTVERWSSSLLAADMKRLQPSLVILGYGTTEGFDDELDVAQYEQEMVKAVAKLKEVAPDASFVIIGPPDAARMPTFAAALGNSMDACRGLTQQEIARYKKWMQKGDTRLARWHAPPKLSEVREALRRVAANSNAYFWDWSKIMGGACGIHAWVHSEPPLAMPDHVQFTPEGAKRSARAFFNELMTGYSASSPAATASVKR